MDEETKTVKYYIDKGLNEALNGEYEKALASFTEAIRLDPQDAYAYANRGVVKNNLDRHEDAIKDYDEAIRLDPQFAGVYYNRGVTKGRLGCHEDEIKDYDEVVRLDPQNASAYYNRGVTKVQLGRHEDAIKDYDEAIRLDPQDADAYYSKGSVKQKLGLFDEAAENYKTFVKLADESLSEYIENAKTIIHEVEEAEETGKPVKQIEAPPLPSAESLTETIKGAVETIKGAVMFLDICNSTETLYMHGDQHYVTMFMDLKKTFYKELNDHDCLFRKNLGDGFMATFEDPANAVRAAINIIKKLKIINIRIGIDYGQMESDSEDSDSYGLTVVTAQRIEGLKKDDFKDWGNDEKFPDKNRIFVSYKIYKSLESIDGFNFREIGSARLKGFGGVSYDIYMVE